MRHLWIRLAGLALVCSALLFAGCLNLGEGTVDPTRLYVLSSLAGTQSCRST